MIGLNYVHLDDGSHEYLIGQNPPVRAVQSRVHTLGKYILEGINFFKVDPLGQYLVGIAAIPLKVLWHEYGHALAGKILYKNVLPHIVLIKLGFNGGYCEWDRWSGLSSAGKYLGWDRATVLVSAAGPLFDIISSVMAIYLKFYGFSCVSTVNSILYAASYFFVPRTQGHDYAYIAEKGGMGAYGVLTVAHSLLFIFSTYKLLTAHAEDQPSTKAKTTLGLRQRVQNWISSHKSFVRAITAVGAGVLAAPHGFFKVRVSLE